jgi:acyl carrier protein phosphodiesterase
MIACPRAGPSDEAMNHLAHALVAAPEPGLMLGSLIADFLRGALDPKLPRDVRIGIALHRAVDTYTDAHPDVVAARALFDPPYRRYAGILLDVWFDHLLARDWNRHAHGSLVAFSHQVQDLLAVRSAELPPRMHGFANYMRAHDLPGAYRDVEVIENVLQGLSQRLSRENPLAHALPVVEALAPDIQRRFDAFFPDLLAHAARERVRLAASVPD